jgi:hypothetical protein
MYAYVTYLFLNTGAMFPGGLGYFAPQTSFHINSREKSSWCNVFSSKSKICTIELKYLLKKLFSILRTFVIRNKMRNAKEHYY